MILDPWYLGHCACGKSSRIIMEGTAADGNESFCKLNPIRLDALLSIPVAICSTINLIIISSLISEYKSSNNVKNDVSDSGAAVLTISIIQLCICIGKFANVKLYLTKITKLQDMLTKQQRDDLRAQGKIKIDPETGEEDYDAADMLIVPEAVYIDKKEVCYGSFIACITDCVFGIIFGLVLLETSKDSVSIYNLFSLLNESRNESKLDLINIGKILGTCAQIVIVVIDIIWIFYAKRKTKEAVDKGINGAIAPDSNGRNGIINSNDEGLVGASPVGIIKNDNNSGGGIEKTNPMTNPSRVEQLNGTFGILITLFCFFEIYCALNVYGIDRKNGFEFEAIAYIILWILIIGDGLFFFIFFVEVFLFMFTMLGIACGWGYFLPEI